MKLISINNLLLGILSFLKEESGNRLISSIQHIVTIIAIIIAGLWFVQTKEHAPRFNVKNIVSQHYINENLSLIRIEVNIENVGSVPINIDSGLIKLSQVSPPVGQVKEDIGRITKLSELDSLTNETRTIAWPYIARRKITSSFNVSPGELELLPFEFVIPNDLDVFQISTELYQIEEESVWKRQTYHEAKRRVIP